MARPTQTRSLAVLSFAPEVRQGPSLGVFAPLNVRAPDSGATRLAEALGIVNEVAHPALAARAEREGFERTSSGMLDQQLGKVDAKRQQEDKLYDRGVKRVAVERTVIDAFAEWQTSYETGALKNASEDDVSEDFNKFMESKLGTLTGDPEAARWAFDRIAPLSEKTLLSHRARLAEEFKNTTIATAGDMVRSNIAADKPTDPEEIMNVLRPVLGRSEATKQYVDMVGALAVEQRNPKLLDTLLPEKWADGTPGARSVPTHANAINQYRYYAEAAADGDAREARKSAAEKVDTGLVQVVQMGAQGDMVGALKALDQMVEAGLPISRAEYTATRQYIEGREDYFNDQQYSPAALAAFRLQLADDPTKLTSADVIRSVGALFPADRNGTQMTAQLMDDVISARKSAVAQQANPVAKAYRSSLVARFKPDAGSSQAKKDRYSAGLLAFDLEFANSKDPEKASEAAKRVFDATEVKAVQPTGDITGDARAFGSGEMDAGTFKGKYGTESGTQSLINAYRSGKSGLTPDQYRKALLQLQGE